MPDPSAGQVHPRPANEVPLTTDAFFRRRAGDCTQLSAGSAPRSTRTCGLLLLRHADLGAVQTGGADPMAGGAS
jgi:hypothetical protein